MADPVSDFLSREKEELAGLEDETQPPPAPVQQEAAVFGKGLFIS